MAKRKKLGEFDFRCPVCGATHHRSAWSIAHFWSDQDFRCDCGARLYLYANSNNAELNDPPTYEDEDEANG